MQEIGRLNGLIRALEAGETAFATFSPAEFGSVTAIASAPYDAVFIEMEHNPFDVRALRECLHYMLDRRRIVASGSVAPAVTPMVRIPPNGSEMNQWIAKQVLDQGVYGIVWPHVSTVEEALNAVSACRYPRPASSERFEPAGKRGDNTSAARYWGLTTQEYYARADVWPLDPKGEIFVAIMVEEVLAIRNLPRMLKEVPGIGAVIIGESDLSQDLGVARQYDSPTLISAVDDILAICHEHDVPCGMPHVGAKRVDSMLKKGMRLLITPPERTFNGLETGLRATGRSKGIAAADKH